MKIGKLDMHCGNCPIIDYCSDGYDDTPPCAQPRFKDVDTDKFLEFADSATGKTRDEMVDDIYKRL